MPFGTFTINLTNIYNEFVLFCSYGLLLISNLCGFNTNGIRIVGWVIISLIISSWIIMWILLLPNVIQEIIKSVSSILKYFQTTENTNSNPAPLEIQKSSKTVEPIMPTKTENLNQNQPESLQIFMQPDPKSKLEISKPKKKPKRKGKKKKKKSKSKAKTVFIDPNSQP